MCVCVCVNEEEVESGVWGVWGVGGLRVKPGGSSGDSREGGKDGRRRRSVSPSAAIGGFWRMNVYTW